MNANADFAKVQPAFLKYRKQPWQRLAQFGRLRDGRGENKKYVLPDLAVYGSGLGRANRRFAQCRKDQAGRQIGAFATCDQCGGRCFGESLEQGFAGLHLTDKKRAFAQPVRIIRRLGRCAGG